MINVTLFDRNRKRITSYDARSADRSITHDGVVYELEHKQDPMAMYREVPRDPWQEEAELPLVTCIMPTTKRRIGMIPTALRSWAEQSYPNKEIIIVSEDGDDIVPILPKHPNVAFRDCGVGIPLGQKRNLAVEWARGSIICHWDDDDWSQPNRIADQVAALRRYPTQVCGYHTLRFNSPNRITREYRMGEGELHGNSLAYYRTHWERIGGFPKKALFGEDAMFISRTAPSLIKRMDGGERTMLAVHHEDNAGKYQYTPEWRVVEPMEIPKAPDILLGMLSWNRADVIEDSVRAMLAERDMLNAFGYWTRTVVLDNGSTDGTDDIIKRIKESDRVIYEKLPQNVGSAVGRNTLIDHYGYNDCALLMDCDISAIPGSALALLQALRANLTSAACVGLDWNNGTEDPAKVSEFLPRVSRMVHSPGLALTQYGMFQAKVLCEYPFDKNFGPGWGGEDNDWAMQVEAATGLQCYMTDEVHYLHRGAHGSLKNLKAGGLDVKADAKSRYEYLIRKWKGHEQFRDVVAFFEDKVKRGDLLPMEVCQ